MLQLFRRICTISGSGVELAIGTALGRQPVRARPALRTDVTGGLEKRGTRIIGALRSEPFVLSARRVAGGKRVIAIAHRSSTIAATGGIMAIGETRTARQQEQRPIDV